MLSDYEDMIFKQLYCQLSNSDSDLHLLLEEIRKEDDRTILPKERKGARRQVSPAYGGVWRRA